jgi:hypothetical protein
VLSLSVWSSVHVPARLPSGSYLAIAHAASDLDPEAAAEATRRNNQTSPVPISEWDLGEAMDTAVGNLIGYSGIARKR